MNDRTSHDRLMSPEDRAEMRGRLIDVLCNSLYPGAKRESAEMVLGYCEAAGLDPMLKPVHIVPMSVKTGQKNGYGGDEYVTRDVVMPGIGLYRINASRTGQYAGMDEPVVGPFQEMTYRSLKREWVAVPGRDKKQPRDTWTDETLAYPEYVSVTVYRLVGGFRVAFTAREYWIENYATASKDSTAPNTMWAKRTIGQLVKCAEAQALRKAFPEVGSQPTAEEMADRGFDYEAEPAEAPAAAPTPARPARASESAATGGVNVDTKPLAITDATPEQQAAAAMIGAAMTPAQEKVLAGAAGDAPAPAAPKAEAQSPAPAPAAAAPAEQAADPASEGEKKNVLVTAAAKKVNLSDVLRALGISLDAATLSGMTKPQFKAIKAKL